MPTTYLYRAAFKHIIIALLKAYLVLCKAFKSLYLTANSYSATSNNEREAMDNQASDHNAEPVSTHRDVKVLFYIVFIASVLATIVNPAYALPIKGSAHASPSPQFIRTKAVIVVDPNGSVIYAKNQDVRLPPASTTKLLTAMVALDRVAPELKVRINKSAIKPHSAPPS
jgi:D-alanyl-D-alanine carboxypeptidase